jgi:hypothetical protein
MLADWAELHGLSPETQADHRATYQTRARNIAQSGVRFFRRLSHWPMLTSCGKVLAA